MGNCKFRVEVIVGIIVIPAMLLFGCGQKGELYLPDHDKDKQQQSEQQKKKKVETENNQ
ncbi:LPS translocon maturation chaperone LptM [Kaarinaea lacus]